MDTDNKKIISAHTISVLATPGNESGSGAGAGAVAGASGPIEFKEGADLKINNALPLYQSKEQFVIDLAGKLYQALISSTANEAKDNANKAIKNAMIFWNVIEKDFGKHIVSNSPDKTVSKSPGKFKFK